MSDYSRGDYADLPAGTTDLENNYTAPDLTAIVSNDNSTYADQTANNEYAIHQYKKTVTSQYTNILWSGKSSLAPSESPVILEVYNVTGTPAWEELDRDDATAADTDFDLSYDNLATADYLDSGVITWRVYQTSGGSTWDISTGSYVDNFETSLGNGASVVSFKLDGTKMYVLYRPSRIIYQYSLSPAWDVTSAIYDSVSFSCASQVGEDRGFAFSADGNHFYVADIINAPVSVYQYDLTAWDLSTAGYANKYFAPGTYPLDPLFNADGTKVYINADGDYKQYTLNPAWDISSANYDSKHYALETSYGASIKPDGSKFYVITRPASNYIITQYSMTSWDISSLTSDSKTLDLSPLSSLSLFIKPDGFDFYGTHSVTNAEVEHYSMS